MHRFQACGGGRAIKHSAQLKVRFCGSCWKEKYVRAHVDLTVSLILLPSVKTNRELEAGYHPEVFVLDLLPSADDGGSTFAVLRRPERT